MDNRDPRRITKRTNRTKTNKNRMEGKNEINEEEIYRFFEADNNILKEEIEILLITEAMKEKGKVTIISNLQKTNIDIHDKMKQWEQLDYLETKNKEIWRNLEYQIRKHEGEILLGPPRNTNDIKILKELEETLNKKEEKQSEGELRIEEIPTKYKIEGVEIRQLTQKTFYELILREKNLKPGGKPTQERIKETYEEHKRKTGNRITNKDI